MTATPDAWTEFCLIGIKRERDSSEVQFAALTEDITGLDFGDKEIEGMPLLNGGRVAKLTPMADESVTLKVYPVSALLDGTGVMQHMHPGTADDTTAPISVTNSNLRQKHRLVIVWATTLPATAEAATEADAAAYRITVANAYMTSYKPSFDDKLMSAEITFKWVPFTKGALGNKKEESTNSGGTVLPAVSATPLDVNA